MITMPTALNDFTTLKFSGAKTQEFLQGQLTCDMKLINQHGQYSLAACCDHRGRMIANFWVVKWHEDYLFVLPSSMTEITKNHLQKYAVFSKVTLSELKNVSILKQDAPDTTSVNQVCITLPNNTHYLILTDAPHTHTPTHTPTHFIEDSLVILKPQTSLLFTPQMINLEKQGGVSFDKGCYVGQEIVARTQHLGTLKRHLHRLQLPSITALNPGDDLKNTQGEIIGSIAESIECEKNKYDVLAVIEDRFTVSDAK